MTKAYPQKPMTIVDRITAYQRFNDMPGHQTGLTPKGSRRLTPRQWRRAQHKRHHEMAPFGSKAAVR